MTILQGYTDSDNDLGIISKESPTVTPCGSNRVSLDSFSYLGGQVVATKTITSYAVSTTAPFNPTITTAAHGAIRGDILLFTSGVLNQRMYSVAGVTTNTITLSALPGTTPSAADAYTIIRPSCAQYDSSGNLKTTAGVSGTIGGAVGTTASPAGFSDGTNLQLARVFDADSGGGTQYVVGVNLRKTANGGSTEILGTGLMAASVPVTIATDDIVSAAIVAQEATTSGVKGLTAFGAVTTAAPTYVTAKSDAISLTVAGAQRVDLNSVIGTTLLTGAGVSGTGAPRVAVARNTIVTATGSASATFTIVAADATNKIKVVGISLITASATAVTVTFKSGANGTALATYPLQALANTNYGIVENVTPPGLLFATAANALLEMSFSAAQTVTYNVRYHVDDLT